MEKNILEIIGTLCVAVFIICVMNVREPVITMVLLYGLLAYLQYTRNIFTNIHHLIAVGIYLVSMFIEYVSDYKFTQQTMINNIWKVPFWGIILFVIKNYV